MLIEITLKTWSGISQGKYSVSLKDEKAEKVFRKLIEMMKELVNKGEIEEINKPLDKVA